MKSFSTFSSLTKSVLSEKFKKRSESLIIVISIVSFIAHLVLILLVDLNVVRNPTGSKLLINPISAIYTPFSFILIYEVYLLIYHLPKSTSVYIGKQYEIVTLIVIRKVFKDLSQIVITEDWFTVKSDIQFTYDLLATVALFALIYLYYRLTKSNSVGTAVMVLVLFSW